MTIRDINDIIKAVCPNDEDYEKPCISPKYLRQELEQLALEQEQKYLEQGSTTKNDLGVDCISRDEVCRYVAEFVNHEFSTREEEELIDNIITGIECMPSATPQEPQTFKWCTDCKEYDQEKHCCHRWSKVIRNAVEALEQEQEPNIDKIRAEIEYAMKYQYAIGEDQYAEGFEKSLEIIDKYKSESEG